MPWHAASSYPLVPLICPARNSPAIGFVSSVRCSSVGSTRRTRWHTRAAASPRLRAPESSAPSPLHVDRQRSRHAVDVDLVRVQPFGLEEKSGAALVRELDDLVFDRRTIARSDALDPPRVHRRPMHVLPDHALRLRRGERDVAATCGCTILLVRKLNGVGSASPGCSSNRDQSIVRPSRRGGVPVLSRQVRRPSR